jgi:hypothetical protein
MYSTRDDFMRRVFPHWNSNKHKDNERNIAKSESMALI